MPLYLFFLKSQMEKTLLSLLLCFTAQFTLWAHDVQYLNYTVDNGLSNNTVYYMMQDSKGFIWCCTESGVSRYDGKNWDNFTLDEGLADNENFKCYEDSQHRIWFLSSNGKFCYYHRGRIYKVAVHGSTKGEEIGMLYDCIEDKKNKDIYFITSTRRLLYFKKNGKSIREKKSTEKFYILSRYNNEIFAFSNSIINNDLNGICLSNSRLKGEKFKFSIRNKKNLSNYFINNACPVLINNNHLLFLTTAGVYQAFKGEISEKFIFQNDLKVRSSVMLTKIGEKLYISGANGVFQLTGGHYSKQWKSKLFFGNILANHIIQDKAGNYWIATYNKGIFFLPKNYSNAKSIQINSDEGTNETYCVVKNETNELLIGMLNGIIAKYSISSNKLSFEKKSFATWDNINRIKHILNFKNNKLYIGDNLFLVEDSKFKRQIFRCDNYYNTLKSYCFNQEKTKIWLASSQFLQEYDLEKNSFSDSIYFPKRASSVALNDQNQLYVGTIHGLFKRSFNKSFTSMNHVSKLLETGVLALLSDNKQIWVATHGCGILLLENDRVKKVLNKKTGLVSNICNQLVTRNNYLYVCTSNGLSIVNKKSFEVTNLSVSDGLISNDVRDVYVDNNQQIYLATDKGISYLNWQDVQKKIDPPLPYLRDFQVNDSIYLTNKSHFEFSYTPGFLSLQFASISFYLPQIITYSYRLKGENEWQSNASGNITFYNLSPGKYEIEVRAKQYKSAWSKPLTTTITVHPLWYQKSSVRLLAVGITVLIFLFFTFWRIRVLRRRDREKHRVEVRINELERRTLAAQMNPHFIFNSLNTLQQLVMDQETENALNYLTDFSKLVRQILNNSRKPVITLQEEIDFLNNYLIVEKIRYNGAFNFQFDVDKDYDELLNLPPMLIQPIIENAIKYGVSTATINFPLIYISMQQTEEYLVFKVSDNGAGMEAVSQLQQKEKLTQSNALEIINERLNLIEINGKKGRLEIESVSNSYQAGTKVSIYIPI